MAVISATSKNGVTMMYSLPVVIVERRNVKDLILFLGGNILFVTHRNPQKGGGKKGIQQRR